MTREALLRKRHRQNRWVKAQRQRVPLEATVERDVVSYLESQLLAWCPKLGKEGWPDRLVLLGKGRHCWFEFKRQKFSHLTAAQRRRIPELRARGEHVYLVKTMEQALDAVQRERSET